MSGLSKYHILVLACLLFGACKEEKKPEPDFSPPSAPGIKITTIRGTQATLQSVYFSTIQDSGFIGKITYIQGWGKALVKSTNGATLKPPLVATEGIKLTQKLGVFSNSPAGTQGIDFGNDVIWEVTQTNLNPQINEVLPYKVPEIGDLNVKDTLGLDQPLNLIIDSSNPFTNLGSVDSIFYSIRGRNGSISKKMGTLDSALFSIEELTSLGIGGAYIQAEAYRYEIKNYNGYKVAFINKGVLNKLVWLF